MGHLSPTQKAKTHAHGTYELHSDHLGTPRVITTASGGTSVIEGRQSYGPYGETFPVQDSGYQPLTGYTGHLQTDPAGLIYMRGRFYTPVWHRFVNSDQGADPSTSNQMAYVGGNPMQAMDPSGMMAVTLHCTWTTYYFWDHKTGRLLGTLTVPNGCTLSGGTGDNGGGGGSLPPQQKNCIDLAVRLAQSQAQNALSEFNASNSPSGWDNFWTGFNNSLSPKGTMAGAGLTGVGVAASRYGGQVLSKTGGVVPSGYPGAIIEGGGAAGWLGAAMLTGQAFAGVTNMYYQNQINKSSASILASNLFLVQHQLKIDMKKCE